MDIRLKRIYDPSEKSDGIRVLVDRVWPRGVRKEEANLDEWLRDIAPSSGLRKWFGHDPAKWEEFVKKYFRELDDRLELVKKLACLAGKGRLTLLFGAKDREYNNGVALKKYLQEISRRPKI